MSRPPLHRHLPLVLLLAGAAVSGLGLLAPGDPVASVDTWPHLARQATVYQALRAGTSPFWSFVFYCGYPMLRFYGPVFALLGGLVALLLGGDQVAALKLLLFTLHLGSGLAMFGWLRHRTRHDWAAVLGALVYLFIPWRTLYLAYGANYPQALVYLLLPLVFWAFEHAVARPGIRPAALLALGLGLLVATHPVYAALAVLFLLVAAPFTIAGPRTDKASRGRAAGFLLLGAAGTLLVSAFHVVPFLLESRSHLFPVVLEHLPSPRLLRMFCPRAGFNGYFGAYLGMSAMLFALAGAGLSLARGARRAAGAAFAGLALAVLTALLAPSAGTAGRLMTVGLPPVRMLLFLVFFAAPLAAGGWQTLARLTRSRIAKGLVLAAVLAALGADCLPHVLGIRYTLDAGSLDARRELYRPMPAGSRVLDLYRHDDRVDDIRRIGRYPSAGYLLGGMASPLGPPYHQFAPRSMLYVYPWANAVAVDLGDTTAPGLAYSSYKALALMGVSRLITRPVVLTAADGSTTWGLKRDLDWDDRLLRAGTGPPLAAGIVPAGLVLASNTLRHVPASGLTHTGSMLVAEDWRRLLDDVDIDPENNALSFIAVPGPGAELPGRPAVLVRSAATRPDRVEMELDAADRCFLRLALSYYPELVVRLDGRPVPFGETHDHFVWLDCPAGAHRLVVTASPGPARAAGATASALALAACLAAVVLPRRRHHVP